MDDYYKYVAPESTDLVIREESPAGSGLDTLLTVLGAEGVALPGGTSDDAQWVDQNGHVDNGSEVRVAVVANQTYFILAGGFGSSTGGYDLTVIPDSLGDTFATAVPLTLSGAGDLTASGSILFAGDVEFFQFVAPKSGAITIQQDAIGSGLDSFLTVFDATQHLITFDDDSDASVTGFYKNSIVQFGVTAGQDLFRRGRRFSQPRRQRRDRRFHGQNSSRTRTLLPTICLTRWRKPSRSMSRRASLGLPLRSTRTRK